MILIGTEIYKFKENDSEINGALLWLGNVSKDFLDDNMKKTEHMDIFMILA